MNQKLSRRHWLHVASWGLLLGSGCNSAGELHTTTHCDVYPADAVPQPLGTFACQWQRSQSARAKLDYLVIYQYEWELEAADMCDAGHRHLDALARMVADSDLPILVEPSGDVNLDQARRQFVVEAMAERGVVIPATQVLLEPGEAEALYGFEAGRITQGFVGGGAGNRGSMSSSANSSGLFGR